MHQQKSNKKNFRDQLYFSQSEDGQRHQIRMKEDPNYIDQVVTPFKRFKKLLIEPVEEEGFLQLRKRTKTQNTKLQLDSHQEQSLSEQLEIQQSPSQQQQISQSEENSSLDSSNFKHLIQKNSFRNQKNINQNQDTKELFKSNPFSLKDIQIRFNKKQQKQQQEDDKTAQNQKKNDLKQVDKNQYHKITIKTERQKKIDKKRKIRTTVSEQKIRIMEHLFPYIQKKLPYQNTVLNLKDLSKILNLGYSTLLHKYRDFRKKGKVVKGLLLQCKDFKRKYGKSLLIQNYIRKSLKQRDFRTAKELASFIKQKYGINANRSIISRHLNQMQKDKEEQTPLQTLRKKIKIMARNEEKENTQTTKENKKQFIQVYLNLKIEADTIQYIAVVRLFFSKGQFYQDIHQIKTQQYQVFDIVLVCSQKEVLHTIIQTGKCEVGLEKQNLSQIAYGPLYTQLGRRVQEQQLSLVSSQSKKLYFVFPFSQSFQEFQYRKSFVKMLIAKKFNLLIPPPFFSVSYLNFISQWIKKEIFPELQNKFFETSIQSISEIYSLLQRRKSLIGNYLTQMIKTLQSQL